MLTKILGNAALWPAEQLINRLVEADTHLLSQVKKFDGKAVQIVVLQPSFARGTQELQASQKAQGVTPAHEPHNGQEAQQTQESQAAQAEQNGQTANPAPGFPIRISFNSSSISLTAIDSAACGLEVDATISADAKAFTTLLLTPQASQSQKPKSSLATEDVQVLGDTQLVQDLFITVNQLDIQWEDILSPVLGDLATHQLGQMSGTATDWLKESHQRMSRNVDDYLREEAQFFPSALELENFASSLDALKLRIDRAEARLAHLESPNSAD